MSDSIVPSIESSPSQSVSLRASTPQSRRADTRRINGITFIRVPHRPNWRRNTEPSQAWIHGDEYINDARRDEGTKWVCDYCDIVIAIPKSEGTANILRHLRLQHQLLKRTQFDRESEDDSESMASCDSSINRPQMPPPSTISALVTRIDIEKFRCLLLRWIIQQQIPFTAIERPEFRELLINLQPAINPFLVKSHQTIANWVSDEFAKAQKAIRNRLAQAISKVHLSFDIWTSPLSLPTLGICAHFLNPSLQLAHILLGLRHIVGSHAGETIAEVMTGVIEEFEVVDKLGVFVADNATNCDMACKVLAQRFFPEEEEGSRRSRCLGHIINLAAQAFIYGKENEAFINAAEYSEEVSIRDQTAIAEEQNLWRTKGAFGKLHNLIKFVRASPQRQQAFQYEVDSEVGREANSGETENSEFGPLKPGLQLILDNATRWNSAFLAIQRALRLKKPFQTYLTVTRGIPNDDILTDDDWAQLAAIYQGLKPFWETTLRLEGLAIQGTHGVIWEALPALDMLLDGIETYINSATQPPSQRSQRRNTSYIDPLLVCYQNAWDVLSKYNNLTDRNHEIYAAAALLNPCLRKRYFIRSWTNDAATEIEPMIEKNRGIWQRNYQLNQPINTPTVSRSALSQYIARI